MLNIYSNLHPDNYIPKNSIDRLHDELNDIAHDCFLTASHVTRDGRVEILASPCFALYLRLMSVFPDPKETGLTQEECRYMLIYIGVAAFTSTGLDKNEVLAEEATVDLCTSQISITSPCRFWSLVFSDTQFRERYQKYCQL